MTLKQPKSIDGVEVNIPDNGYQPTEEELQRLDLVWKEWSDAQRERDKRYPHFNNRTLRRFIDDNQKRFNLFQRPRRNTEDWQAKVVSSISRNKVLGILARIAGQRTKTEFFAEDNDDTVRSKIIQALYDSSKDNEKLKMPDFNQALSAIVKGTVVVFEGYKKTDWNKYNDVFSEIVRLEDFYPGDIRQRNIQEMPHVFWVTYPKWSIFQNEFKNFPNAKFVLPGGEVRTNTFYNKYVSSELPVDRVMVIKWFNKVTDSMDIMASGVLLTKLDEKLPYRRNVKKGRGLPFFSFIYEPFEEDFFWGQSLLHKLKGETDSKDTLMRMMLDQLFLSIHPPILSNAINDIEDELLVPGRRIPITGDASQTREIKISSPDAAIFNMLGYLDGQINNASIDNVTQGVGGTGNTKTATEVERAREGALEMLSLFLKFVENGREQEATLRVSNILENYPKPIGRENGKNIYRTIRVDNMPLVTSNGVGSVIIEFTENPPKVNMNPETKKRLKEKYGDIVDKIIVQRDPVNKKVEKLFLTPEALKDFDVGVRIIANSSVGKSRTSEQREEVNFQTQYLTLYPELADKVKMAAKMTQIFERAPEEYSKTGGKPTDGPPAALGGQGTPAGEGLVPSVQNVRENLEA